LRRWLNQTKKETPAMKILALDIGKYKSVGCDYEAQSGRHSFVTIATTPKALHDVIVELEPDRVVIEICSIAGWICDLVRSLGFEIRVANTTDERWRCRKVKQESDRRDGKRRNCRRSINCGRCMCRSPPCGNGGR
jgi:hypothetical protein